MFPHKNMLSDFMARQIAIIYHFYGDHHTGTHFVLFFCVSSYFWFLFSNFFYCFFFGNWSSDIKFTYAHMHINMVSLWMFGVYHVFKAPLIWIKISIHVEFFYVGIGIRFFHLNFLYNNNFKYSEYLYEERKNRFINGWSRCESDSAWIEQ